MITMPVHTDVDVICHFQASIAYNTNKNASKQIKAFILQSGWLIEVDLTALKRLNCSFSAMLLRLVVLMIAICSVQNTFKKF
jgi:hypothetical protein